VKKFHINPEQANNVQPLSFWLDGRAAGSVLALPCPDSDGVTPELTNLPENPCGYMWFRHFSFALALVDQSSA
jgi:hypothetical protein